MVLVKRFDGKKRLYIIKPVKMHWLFNSIMELKLGYVHYYTIYVECYAKS